LGHLLSDLRKQGLTKRDSAWLVIDKDNWTDEQLREVYEWADSADQYGVALSNPKFEYWLLLHFEDGNDVKSSAECDTRLGRYCQGHEKAFDASKLTEQAIRDAIARARRRNTPPCERWPTKLGCTTVYLLVEKILNAQENRG
jgi:hypothetical protein